MSTASSRQTSFSSPRAVPACSVQWNAVNLRSSPDSVPKQRALHVGAVVGDAMYIFGGYDGSSRLNDIHKFEFQVGTWQMVQPASSSNIPSARDRMSAVSYRESMYIFGGYDGTNRVNDLWRFDTIRNSWDLCEFVGQAPSARHSHNMVESDGKLYILFGYDGNYKSDIHEYCVARKTWVQITAKGSIPRPRYRSSVVVHSGTHFLSFGGHDGLKHLDELYSFDLGSNTWSLIEPLIPISSLGPYAIRTLSPNTAPPPSHRDSHSAVVHGESMFVFGGSTGVARNDLFEYRIDLNAWIEVQSHSPASPVDDSSLPCPRFCHVGVTYKDCMYIHGGYDGQNRLSDFRSFSFLENVLLDIPPPTILADIHEAISDPTFSDVAFSVDGQVIKGHRVILARCEFFSALFQTSMSEKSKEIIPIHDVSIDVFKTIVAYLYTDEVDESKTLADPLAVFTAADRFGIDRLKRICEQAVLSSICIDNACSIFHAADMVNASLLRKRALEYLVRHYDAIVKTSGFEELARRNIELTLEIIRLR
jgi:N-acetylneuraminic acid mutarotase